MTTAQQTTEEFEIYVIQDVDFRFVREDENTISVSVSPDWTGFWTWWFIGEANTLESAQMLCYQWTRKGSFECLPGIFYRVYQQQTEWVSEIFTTEDNYFISTHNTQQQALEFCQSKADKEETA